MPRLAGLAFIARELRGNRTGARTGAVENGRRMRWARSGCSKFLPGRPRERTARHLLLRLLVVAALAGAAPAAPAAESATGFEHLRAGRVDAALAFFQTRLAQQPDDLTALNMVGAIHCLKDEPAVAIAYFERALKLSPDFVPARKNLAIAEFDLGRYQAAEGNLRKLLEVPAARGQANLFLGLIASESGQHEQAVRRLAAAGDLVASQPRAQIAYARSLDHVGRIDMAKEVLAEARSRADLAGPDLVDSAQVAGSLALFDEALADLERAEALDPTLADLGRRRVSILVEAERDEEALTLARQLASGSPSADLLALLAELAENSGDLAAAIDARRKAIQVAPTQEDGYIQLSEFCVKYRNPELALEILDLGLSRIPKSYRLLVQKGITLGQGQRYEAARQAFTEAIAITPDHSVALTALAVTLILSEAMPDALETLRVGVARFPHDFYMHYIYGFALDRSRAEGGAEGREALAEKHLRKAIELNGEFPSAYYRLGKLLAERDAQQAIRNLEAAVRLDPSLTAAKYQLGQLYLDSGRQAEGERLMQEVGAAKQRELETEQMPQFRAVKTPPGS